MRQSWVNWVSIGSGNGLSPVRRQAITRTNVDILLIGLLETNFNEFLIDIHDFSFMKIHLKMSSCEMAAILSRGDELRNKDGHLELIIWYTHYNTSRFI